MRVIETKVYEFDELSDRAKERARDWYRERVFDDSCDWEFVYENAVRVAEILGIEISTHPVKLMGGGTRQAPDIWFSGFWSQGDGACFEGTYSYKKGATKKIRRECPADWEYKQSDGTVVKGHSDDNAELHRIADALQAIQRKHFYRLTARMKNSRGCASYDMGVEVEDSEDPYRDIGSAEDEVRDLMRAFADWIYGCLESEYEYQSSDEAVDEAIQANEYEFDEEGNRA